MGRKALLCHACGNGNCSNPKHLYWGTDYENIVLDGKEHGTFSGQYDNMVKKYGSKEAVSEMMKKNINRESCAKGGRAGKGIPKSEEQKRKISETLKNKKFH